MSPHVDLTGWPRCPDCGLLRCVRYSICKKGARPDGPSDVDPAALLARIADLEAVIVEMLDRLSRGEPTHPGSKLATFASQARDVLGESPGAWTWQDVLERHNKAGGHSE